MCAPDSFPTLSCKDDDQLLEKQEVVLVVDDFVQITNIIQEYLNHHHLQTRSASSVREFRQVMQEVPVALVLLDINLPDGSGVDLISEIKKQSPDTTIIMLSGVTDLQTALKCIRYGADDYLTKPVHFDPFWETVRNVLEKRRLKIRNRQYQVQIEQANFRLRLLHDLTMKMNTAYLSMTALDEILQAILVGITAEEGLRFNRAFLALFDSEGQVLTGRLAIGPSCREDAGRIWHEISSKELHIGAMIDSIKTHDFHEDSKVNRIVKALKIRAEEQDNLLIRVAKEQRSINVKKGSCVCGTAVPLELMGLLEEDSFVVVPLFSQTRSLGVIIADHFITGKDIDKELVHALECFAGQASLAIEHCELYMHMQSKIEELELVTHELGKNKDMLVEAERYAAVGQVAAQLAHNIRNPITAIGGTARLLSRKISDPQQLNFLNMMVKETARIEQTLEDLFNFVDTSLTCKEEVRLYPLLMKSLMLFYSTIQKQKIHYQVLVPNNTNFTWKMDPRQMKRVFVHLIRNAVESMENGGELVLEALPQEGELTLAVRDSGTGIPASDLYRATDPFYTTKVAGTGVGLAVVERIVRNHQGHLHICQRENGGTEVLMYLPQD
jgi:nitrogen-specific signal transduction histidine kinase/DNA-binding response OmpR family regulator